MVLVYRAGIELEEAMGVAKKFGATALCFIICSFESWEDCFGVPYTEIVYKAIRKVRPRMKLGQFGLSLWTEMTKREVEDLK
jgi:hypothetical protein